MRGQDAGIAASNGLAKEVPGEAKRGDEHDRCGGTEAAAAERSHAAWTALQGAWIGERRLQLIAMDNRIGMGHEAHAVGVVNAFRLTQQGCEDLSLDRVTVGGCL